MKKIVVPREKAVFWMDGNGQWHNKHGRFEHKKVIDYFNSSIRRDEGGYHVFQATEEFEEKVYFPHEGTALFVVDLIADADGVTLELNTHRKVELNPAELFIMGDDLYIQLGDERAKFTGRGLMKLSGLMEKSETRCVITIAGHPWEIAEVRAL